jgi:acetylglutamate kinase
MTDKVDVLLEALPYIKQFFGTTFVIKYGGAAMEEEKLAKEFAKDIVLLKYVGINPVIVHGGGPQIEKLLTRLGIPTRFVDGLRVTDEATLEVVEMVLSGLINKTIVQEIQNNGGQALGVSGKDGKLLVARKVEGKDIGFVGDVVEVNVRILKEASKLGYIPVVAPLAAGPDGQTYNVNADTAAGAIAKELMAEKFILLTDVPGVLDASGKLISAIRLSELNALASSGALTGGMIPKVRCCAEAVSQGVAQAHVIDGRIEHSVLLEVFTDQGVGTQIYADV